MFILSNERDDDSNDVVELFESYLSYLKENIKIFPKNAYTLATSDWYFNFSEHKCPHDSWLENIEIREISAGNRQEKRALSITIKLLAPFHDGYILLQYPIVYNYSINFLSKNSGHRDFRYDEFRVSNDGHLIHEIEWCGMNETARWVIEASDVIYTWIPVDFSKLNANNS